MAGAQPVAPAGQWATTGGPSGAAAVMHTSADDDIHANDRLCQVCGTYLYESDSDTDSDDNAEIHLLADDLETLSGMSEDKMVAEI